VIREGRIEHEMTYPHPPERVWQALTDPAELSAWLMPTNFTPQPGSQFTLDARPELGIVAGDSFDQGWHQKLTKDLAAQLGA
jgi:uncharacterized protein YndB with AHSA1/START domain